MKAKELVIDFIAFLFFLAIVIFVIVYFIVGNRIYMVAEILRSLVPFSVFGIIFLFKCRKAKKDYIEAKEENNSEEQFIYLNRSDWIKNFLINILSAVLVLIIAIIDKSIDIIDCAQILFTFSYLTALEVYLFRKRDNIVIEMYIDYIDKIVYLMAIYFLPIFVYGLAFVKPVPNMIDVAQAVLAFLPPFIWNNLLLKQKRHA